MSNSFGWLTHENDKITLIFVNTYETSLRALADPTRRKILELLRAGSATVGEIGRTVPISQPAVSQHLAVLRAAGLVASSAEGARRRYAIDPSGLIAVRAYIDGFWDDALRAFQSAAGRVAKTDNEE